VRSRTVAGLAAGMVVVLAVVAGACGGKADTATGEARGRATTTPTASVTTPPTASSGDSTDGSTPTTPAGATSGAAAPEGCNGVAPKGEYAVGRQQVTLVDPGRPTAADPSRNLAAAPDRTIGVTVLYPATGDAGAPGTFTDGATAAKGRWPVVIHSHGVDSTGTERNDTLATWARAGYVVVAPTFPLSSNKGGQITDVANQPADVMFVDAQLRDPGSPLAPLAAHVQASCLALAGHSLGAITTVASTFDPCCRPPGQKAAVAIAGGLFAPTAGFDWAQAPEVPLLLVHGEKDARVPYAKSPEMRSTLPGPTWLLRFPEGQHSNMFDPPLNEPLDDTVVAFLDAELRGDAAALDTLPARIATRTDAVLEPPAPG
jgi:dienelactone hydrolase